MEIERFELPGALMMRPRRHDDERGWFSETWSAPRMAAAGVDVAFVQDNHSHSAHAGTLRGLHYQAPPRAQAKLVRCSRGAVWDVAVDVRRGSPTYGRSIAVELSAQNARQIFIPVGFLHGFLTLTNDAEVQYKCSDVYAPEYDGTVHWDSVGIDWALSGAPILSPKDAAAPLFAQWTSPFTWDGAQ